MPSRPCGCYGTVSNGGNRHKRTEKSLPDERSIRFPFSFPLVVHPSLISISQTAEILTLLFEATHSPDPTRQDVSTLDPTAGTRPRTDSYSQIKWENDPSRPGGGVFVTKDPKVTKELSDVGEGVIVNESPATSSRRDSQTPVDGQGNPATSPAADRAPPSAPTSTFNNSNIPQSNGSGSMDTSVPDTFNMFEGVPGNMFDWSASSIFFFCFAVWSDLTHCYDFEGRWDEWLQSIHTLEPIIVAGGAGGVQP